MLILSIAGNDHQICSSWEDVTLLRYIEFLTQVQPQAPRELQAAWAEPDKEKRGQILANMADGSYINYCLKVIARFSTITFEELASMEFSQHARNKIEQIYGGLMKVFSKIPAEKYHSSIEIKGEKFAYPQPLMQKSTFGEYAEAAQFQELVQNSGGIELQCVAKIACALLRKEGEKFTGAVDLEREPLFLQMNMYQAWQLSFFLQRLNDISQKVVNFYFKNGLNLSILPQDTTN